MLFYEILSSMDIHLLAFGRCEIGGEWNYQNINSHFNRLLLVLEGSASLTHHAQHYHLEKGSLHLIPCYTPCNYACKPDGAEIYYLHFTSRSSAGIDLCGIREYQYQRKARPEDLAFFKQLHQLNPNLELPTKDPATNRYQGYHDQLQKNYTSTPPKLHLENMALISLILVPFLPSEPHTQPNQTESKRMRDFVTYVEKNLHRAPDLHEISDVLGITPNYLSDWLFKTLQTRPVAYINRRRIEESQQLLASTQKGIQEIANELGFTSPTYFARVFKNQIGITASRYRALHFFPPSHPIET